MFDDSSGIEIGRTRDRWREPAFWFGKNSNEDRSSVRYTIPSTRISPDRSAVYSFTVPILSILTWGGAPSLRADTVFTNLNATSCFCGGQVVAGPPINVAGAAAFTPLANYLATGAGARFYTGDLASGMVNFAIYSNSSNLPGTMLGSLGPVTVPSNSEGR